MLDIFIEEFKTDDVIKTIGCRTYCSTLDEFFASHGANGEPKFNLITAVNSLYFSRDLRDTMDRLFGVMKRNGVIVAELASGENNVRGHSVR